jgi:FkbM family methyltransferase
MTIGERVRGAAPLPLKRSLRIATKSALPVATRADLLRVEARLLGLRLRHPRVPRRELRAGRDGLVRLGGVTTVVSAPHFHIDYVTIFDKLVDDQFKTDYRGAVVLDIGAHCGYLAAYALYHGAAAVLSYEPQSHNFAVLARTRDGARLAGRHWEVHQQAVGAEEKRIELYVSRSSRSHSIIAGAEAVGSETVEMVAFPAVLDRARALASGAPVVVKLNVEGAAGEIVLGTPEAAWRAVDCLMMDWEESTPVPLARAEEHLAAAGLHRDGGAGRHYRFTRR